MKFGDTLIISKCIWQIIRNALQIDNFLNFTFRFYSTWIIGLDTSSILIYFLAFCLVLVSP
jgi:hypothetical protein